MLRRDPTRSWLRLWYVLCLGLCYKCSGVHGYYFRLGPGKKLCFPEEIVAPNELVIVDYAQRAPENSPRTSFNTLVQIYAPNRKVLQTSTLEARNGTFSFRTKGEMLGEYDICLSAAGSGADFVDFALSIDTRNRQDRIEDPEPQITRQQVTEHGVDMEVMSFMDSDGQVKDTLRTKTFLNRIHRELYNIRQQIAEARATASIFRRRFLRFRATSEDTYERVYIMAFLSIMAAGGLAIYQYRSLKGFLLKKKLV